MRSSVNRAAVIAIAALIGASCTTPPVVETPPNAPVSVQVVTVAQSNRPAILIAGGTLHGRRSAVVSSRVMATVRDVLVKPGDRVRSGQLLVQLDDASTAADVKSAAAGHEMAGRGLDRARAELEAVTVAAGLAHATNARIAVLHERRSATDQERDDAEAAVAAAKARVSVASAGVAEATAALARAAANVDSAGATAGWSRVTAPFDGVITEKMIEPGVLAMPGMPLVQVEDTGGLELDVRLDDSRASWATPGATVRVLIDADGAVVDREGRITEAGRAASLDSRAVTVTITLSSAQGLRPGMFGRAELPGAARDVIAIPESAVMRRGQLTSVFVVDRGVARMRLVRLGASDGRDVEVVAGLASGEQIVLSPAASLHDGAAIRPATPGARP